MPTISVLTPSVRPEGLLMVNDCLQRQTMPDFEWLISLPAAQQGSIGIKDPRVRLLTDPPPQRGDFYSLNKAWNQLVREAQSDILVFAVDWIWFKPQTLQQFLLNLRDAAKVGYPKAGVCAMGPHFRWRPAGGVGRPEILWRVDPREAALEQRPLPEKIEEQNMIPPEWMELALACLPRQPILDIEGFDERFDRGAGMSEKDLCVRLAEQHGVKFWLDPTIECRNWTHPKTSTTAEWDAAYQRAVEWYAKCRRATKPAHDLVEVAGERLGVTLGVTHG